MLQKSICLLGLITASLVTVSAAELAGEAPAAKTERREVRVKGVNGVLLHKIDVGPDHTIEFFQFDTGDTAVRETFSIDSGELPLVDSLDPSEPRSLASIFRHVVHKEPPKALLTADAEAALLAVDKKNWPKPATPPDSSNGGPASPTQSSALGARTLSATAQAGQALPNCSSDVLGDNWGSAWFLQNYCNTGAYRTCNTNWGWGNTTRTNFKWWSYRQFEGDFNVAGHTNGAKNVCSYLIFYGWVCNWEQVWSADLAPRKATVWTAGSDNSDGLYANGTSPCGHLDMATLTNK